MSLFTLKTRDGTQYGPVETETLRAWFREGRIVADDQIYDHTRLSWSEAARLPQLLDLFQPSAVPSVENKNFSISKDPLSVTEIEDPLSRVEKQVAARMKTARDLASNVAASDQRKGSTRMKLKSEFVRTDKPAPGSEKAGATAAPRPPTVLDRITKIFLTPFLRKKPRHGKKHS